MSEPAASVEELLARARSALAAVSDEAALEAWVLLGHALGRTRAWLIAHSRDPVCAAQTRGFDALVERRCSGEPVAYILGRREFWSLDLVVSPGVLIPRADTECLVEQALERLPADSATLVLDAGTGSGAVALAIARERPAATVVASDVSARALEVAAANVARLAPGRVHLLRGDWLAPLAAACWDVIASNPPYLAGDDPHLDTGDLRFEPRDALVAGERGLAAIAGLARAAAGALRAGGWLLVEHGIEQGDAVRGRLRDAGLTDVRTYTDLAGAERVTEGRRAT